uniref:GNAT family N-acetyltransferase n=1 Tax=Ningiella ruwaisensis TaxID=2364274 RepID=UPI00109FC7D6|nr:N-acetyltransferase [Ningiella ruwaisensis]
MPEKKPAIKAPEFRIIRGSDCNDAMMQSAYKHFSKNRTVPWSYTSFKGSLSNTTSALMVGANHDYHTVLGMIIINPIILSSSECFDAEADAKADSNLDSLLIDSAELEDIWVVSSYRRQGLAKTLLEWGIHELCALQCPVLHLEVNADNHAAIKLYERFGFVNVGRRKNYYDDGKGNKSDAFLYSLNL